MLSMSKIHLNCIYCRKSVCRYNSQISESNQVFCSKECYDRSRLIHLYKCLWCETPYHRSVRLNQTPKFCSKVCECEYRKSKTPKNCVCLVCKKIFHRSRYAIEHGEGKYCSRECKYKGTSGLGIYGGVHRTSLSSWRKTRLQRLEIDKHKCTVCGSNKLLHVHHIDGNTHNDHIDNLVTICNSCHVRKHWKDGDYKSNFLKLS